MKNFGPNGDLHWSVKTLLQNGEEFLAVINNNSLIARHFSKKIQTGSIGFLDTTFVYPDMFICMFGEFSLRFTAALSLCVKEGIILY